MLGRCSPATHTRPMLPGPGWHPDPADPARLRWWDGERWTETVRHRESTPPPVGEWTPAAVVQQSPDGCAVCGAMPSRETTYRTIRGMVILMQWRTFRARLCRECGEAAFRESQDFTLRWGWWGLFSFFITLVLLVRNLRARSLSAALEPGAGRHRSPLDPGKPVTQRWGVWIAGAVAAWILASAVL